MNRLLDVIAVISCIVLAGCAAPAAAPTPLPPTEAPTAPPPTPAPSATTAPTATAVPTPTSAPGVISSPDQLGLPSGFVAVPKDDLAAKLPPELLTAAGFKEDRKDPYFATDQLAWFQFPVKASFGFANADNTQFVYGYAVDLSGPQDAVTFDARDGEELVIKTSVSLFHATKDVVRIKNVAVGDKAYGVTAKPIIRDFPWVLNIVPFRLGTSGAFVFTLYPASVEAPIDVVKLAEVYAGTLK
jgi:hypothetical protein